MISRRSLLLGSASGFLCAPFVARASNGGDESEGGIGGTGVYFGPVLNASSPTINGRRLASGIPAVRAALAGQPNLAGSLGDTLFITGAQTSNDLAPQQAVRFLPLVGRIDGLGGTGGPLRVLGTPIVFASQTILQAANGSSVSRQDLVAGRRIAISGIWRSQSVIATRIVVLGNDGASSISGQVGNSGSGIVIGRTRLQNVRARPGDFLTLVGEGNGREFRARNRASGFSPYFDASRRQFMSAAGYLAPDADGRGYHLSGFGLPMDPASTVSPTSREARVFEGIYDRSFLIQRAT